MNWSILLLVIHGFNQPISDFDVLHTHRIRIDDTIRVDTRFDEINYNVYHYQNGSNFVFGWHSDKSWVLKRVDNKRAFTGVLIVVDGTIKLVCPFSNGIPNGSWRRYVTPFGDDTASEYSFLEYNVNVVDGFFHGTCVTWKYNYFRDSIITDTQANFDRGYPKGTYNEGNGRITADFTYVVNDKLRAYAKYESGDIRHSDQRYRVEELDLYLQCLIRDAIYDYSSSNDYFTYLVGCKSSDEQIFKGMPQEMYKQRNAVDVITQNSFVNRIYHRGLETYINYEQYFWNNGYCIREEHYNIEFYDDISQNYLERRLTYEYFTGYVVKRDSFRVHLICSDNRNASPIWMKDGSDAIDVFADWDFVQLDRNAFWIDTVFYQTNTVIVTPFKGSFKHGKDIEEWKIGRTLDNGKFQVAYNYSQGDYFLDSKVGKWSYYRFINGKPRLLCTTEFKYLTMPIMNSFVIGKPFPKYCEWDWYNVRLNNVVHGEQLYYNLNGTPYIGYRYVDGAVVGLIKY